jgi:SOS-response transcriptional repressor LexA
MAPHKYKPLKFKFTPSDKNVWAVFVVIYKFINKNHYPPSIREIVERGEMKSTSYTLACMRELEARGWITRNGGPKAARDTVITRLGKEIYAKETGRPGQTTSAGQPLEVVIR